MSMASPIWPTAYTPRPRRGLVFLTFAIVAITGFFRGIALHPLQPISPRSPPSRRQRYPRCCQ